MTQKRAYLLITILLGNLLSHPASADSMRCGTQLVTKGDRAYQVLRKCGEPDYREVVGYTSGYYHRHEMLIEDWIYGPKHGAFRILHFEGNRLKHIEMRRED